MQHNYISIRNIRNYIVHIIIMFLLVEPINAELNLQYQGEVPFLSLFFLDDQYGWAGGGNTLIRTSDGGDTWETTHFPEGRNRSISNISFVTREIGFCRYLFFDSYQESDPVLLSSLYKTHDGGMSWEKLSSLPDSVTAYSFCDENTGWACIRHTFFQWEVLKTTDGGLTWMSMWRNESGGIFDQYIQLIDIFSTSPDTCWVLHAAHDHERNNHFTILAFTEDGGSHWENKYTLEENRGFRSYGRIAEVKNEYVWLTGILDHTQTRPKGGGYIRYNAITNQVLSKIDLPPVWEIMSVDNYKLFHIYRHPNYDHRDCVFRSTDNGITLEPYFILPHLYPEESEDLITSFATADERTFWLASMRGDIFKYMNKNTVGIKNNNLSMPSTITLYPASPNPFNPRTTIRFFLSERSDVELSVFNTSGQKTVTLIKSDDLGPGLYSVPFYGNGYASGIYFFICKTKTICKIGKMVLMK